jgi:hypothetical protein
MALPFTAAAMAATLAPRIEIYTILACSVHKPEYTMHLSKLPDSNLLVSKSSPGFGTSPSMPANFATEQDIARTYFTGLPDASNDTEGDNKSSNRCASDPEVQAAVAKLTAGE